MALPGGGDHPRKVTFAQDHAIVPQDVVGRGDVKIGTRQREARQELARREFRRLPAQRKIDYALLCGPEGVAVDDAVALILKGLDPNRGMIGIPFWPFWLGRVALLSPEPLRRFVTRFFRFHFDA